MIEDGYTDIHSHVLFGVDDGARGIDESMQMLKTARNEGITTVFATPHYGIKMGTSLPPASSGKTSALWSSGRRLSCPTCGCIWGQSCTARLIRC